MTLSDLLLQRSAMRQAQLPQREDPEQQPMLLPPVRPDQQQPDQGNDENQQRLMSLAGLLSQVAQSRGSSGGYGPGGGVPGGFTSGGDNPWGIDPNGMDLITRHGVTLDADAMAVLRAAAHATGIKPWPFLGQGYRTLAQSAAAYNNPTNNLPHAPPGQSMHNYGLAFDQSRSLPELLADYLLSHGWYNGASWGDPPHWSYGRNG